MIKDNFGGFEELSAKVRNQIRKSLKIYDIKKVTGDEMLNCFALYNMAIGSYKVKAPLISYDKYIKSIENGKSSCKIDYWQVVNKDTKEIVAFSINNIELDWGYCSYSTMKANPQYLKGSTYPYYGLIYKMNQYYLEELHLKYVDDGARSITEHSNVQPFLIEKFGFRKAYCKLKIHYKWYVGFIIYILYPFRNLVTYKKIQVLLRQEAMARGRY